MGVHVDCVVRNNIWRLSARKEERKTQSLLAMKMMLPIQISFWRKMKTKGRRAAKNWELRKNGVS
jgi:hypothetical protein